LDKNSGSQKGVKCEQGVQPTDSRSSLGAALHGFWTIGQIF
jgi:hypothetical protein